MATLRGSKWAELKSIAETLQLALDSAKSEGELIKYISGIIKSIRKEADELEPNAHKR
jgi:hypothetical protein